MTLLLTNDDTVVETQNVSANATYCHEQLFIVVVLFLVQRKKKIKECNLRKVHEK